MRMEQYTIEVLLEKLNGYEENYHIKSLIQINSLRCASYILSIVDLSTLDLRRDIVDNSILISTIDVGVGKKIPHDRDSLINELCSYDRNKRIVLGNELKIFVPLRSVTLLYSKKDDEHDIILTNINIKEEEID